MTRTTTISTTTTQTAIGSAVTWSDYLDAVETAVREVQTCLLEGREPSMPVLTLPSGPPPAQSVSRRTAVAELLAEVTAQVENHRDSVADRLASLPTRRPRHQYHAAAVGGKLDVAG